MKTAVIDKNKPKDQKWDLVTEPHRAWWDLRPGQLWRYRDLSLCHKLQTDYFRPDVIPYSVAPDHADVCRHLR